MDIAVAFTSSAFLKRCSLSPSFEMKKSSKSQFVWLQRLPGSFLYRTVNLTVNT